MTNLANSSHSSSSAASMLQTKLQAEERLQAPPILAACSSGSGAGDLGALSQEVVRVSAPAASEKLRELLEAVEAFSE